jgi:hypothetical protein
VDILARQDHARAVGVKRAFRPFKSRRGRVSRGELRGRCEDARLDLRALFRALDRLFLLVDVPPEVRSVLELDADLAEALWALDQPKGRIDRDAMERDTLASLARIPASRERLLDLLSVEGREEVLATAVAARSRLTLADAYLEVPGRDPSAG